ncbi:MAG: hypothetical protein CVV27_01920 [Candidatus Melainabacteria bacterium HGW-Melainabacteria-1]|nr:MAG: hypothetical protein CVV27_01920 [Candidatus Melainabacteria bacterium HGW-Melainabacteria-1]
MEALQDEAWVVSPESKVLASNQAAHSFLAQGPDGEWLPQPPNGDVIWTRAYAQVQDQNQSLQFCWYERPAARLLNVSLTPLLAPDGSLQGILGMARTAQIKAEQSNSLPQDVHALLENVIHFLPNPVFVKDRYHRWIILNDAFCSFLGIGRETLIGKSDYDVFPPEEADVFWEKDDLVFANGELNENEEAFTDSNGAQRWILTRKSAFLDPQGNPILVGVITDLTERKRTEEALQQAMQRAEEANLAKSDFLAKMSHELRTPLNSILGFTTLLLKTQTHSERESDFLMRIHRNGRHLLSLINDILDLSRVESGQIPFHFETIELSSLLQEVLDGFEIQAQEKNLNLSAELAPVLPFTTDRERLKQILFNLVSNAIKFTVSGSVRLCLRADAQGRASQLEVIDTGPGIPPERQAEIFEAFRQLDNAQSGGTGLGLAIVSNLCEHLGYALELKSSPGQGSCFRLHLQKTETGAEASD